MSELELQDAILRNALELQRLSANDEARALEIMRQLEADLRSLLARETLDARGKREIEAILREATKLIDTRYSGIAAVVDTQAIAIVVAEQTVSAMSTLGSVVMPTPERLASLTKDVLIDGAPSSAWWKRQAEDTAFRFAREVRQGVIEGATNEQIVGRIIGRGDEPGILDTPRRNVRSLVHSSVMNAANQARLETYRKNSKHVAGVRWLATLDSHTCRTCMALDGSTWDLEGKPLDGTTLDFQVPPAHFSCFTGDTPVLASGGITGASKRWFDGEVIVIKTASGREVTCTPNHPILTDRGWVAAGLMNEGCNVICQGGRDRFTFVDGDGQNAPALIHNVAEAVLASAPMGAVPMIPTAPDFHGDGAGSEIAVIWSDSLLPDARDPARNEHFDKFGFVGGGLAREVALPSGSHPAKLGKCLDAVGRGDVGGPSVSHTLSLGHSLHAGHLLLAPIPDCHPHGAEVISQPVAGHADLGNHVGDSESFIVKLDRLGGVYDLSSRHGPTSEASPPQSRSNRTEFEAALVSDLLASFPGEIQLDNVVSADRIDFSGHVYNLETSGGWYLAQGIVSHNCRCVASPLPKSFDEILGRTGIDAIFRSGRVRASKDGPTTATTFDEFLRRQSPEFVEDMLGTGRANLWRQGKITLRDLVSGSGRELSLDDIRARIQE